MGAMIAVKQSLVYLVLKLARDLVGASLLAKAVCQSEFM